MCGWIMLQLSEIWLENVQINHKADTTFTSFQDHLISQNAEVLMYSVSTPYQDTAKKFSPWHYLNMSPEWYMYNWVGREIQSRLCLNHIWFVLYGVKDNTWIWTCLYKILYIFTPNNDSSHFEKSNEITNKETQYTLSKCPFKFFEVGA